MLLPVLASQKPLTQAATTTAMTAAGGNWRWQRTDEDAVCSCKIQFGLFWRRGFCLCGDLQIVWKHDSCEDEAPIDWTA